MSAPKYSQGDSQSYWPEASFAFRPQSRTPDLLHQELTWAVGRALSSLASAPLRERLRALSSCCLGPCTPGPTQPPTRAGPGSSHTSPQAHHQPSTQKVQPQVQAPAPLLVHPTAAGFDASSASPAGSKLLEARRRLSQEPSPPWGPGRCVLLTRRRSAAGSISFRLQMEGKDP